MALTDSGIAQTRNEISNLISSKAQLLTSLETLKSSIQSDENFQIFRAGTDIGDRCNEKIEKIIEIANKSCSSTDGVISTTMSFLEQQAAINREKAQFNVENGK